MLAIIMASLFERFLLIENLCARLDNLVSSGFRLAIFSAILVFTIGLPASGQQLVQNGTFETGDFSGWTQSGSTASTFVSTNSLYAHSGAYGAQLGPSGSLGFISQTLATTFAQTNYFLSLWLDSPNGSGPNEFRVSWNGAVIFDQTNIGALGWTNLQFTVAATGTNTVLQFGFQDNPSYLGLDDISVTNIPAQNNSAAYTWTTIAGYPNIGSADGVGSIAQFNYDTGIAVDSAKNVYVADQNNSTIRKITPAGLVSTIAGIAGYTGNVDGDGRVARFNNPFSLSFDAAGNLYVADTGNQTIRKLTPAGTNWTVSTIAGLAGSYGSADGINSSARFHGPSAVVVDAGGNLYVADTFNDTIRKLAPSGTNWTVSTIAGLAGSIGGANGTNSIARFYYPIGITVDSATNLYVADKFNNTIRKITQVGNNSWAVTTIAGGSQYNFGSTDGTGTNALFQLPYDVAGDGAGNLYVADGNNNEIRKISPSGTNWIVTTFAGSVTSGSADGTGSNAAFQEPQGVAVDSSGYVYVADTYNNEVREITTAGSVKTIAGSTGSAGSANGTGSTARFNLPTGVAVDNAGNVFVADYDNDLIREITSLGEVSTIAGLATVTGANDGVGSDARFNFPIGLAVDANDNLYVADRYNNEIRRITSPGIVSTLAGNYYHTNIHGAYIGGFADGTGSSALFTYPEAVAVDANGNLYVADSANNAIRKITPTLTFVLFQGFVTSWVVTTIAAGYGSADGANSVAKFSFPEGVAVDGAGNLYVADTDNATIRKITPVIGTTNWVVSTIAGQVGVNGSADGIGTNALFYQPGCIAVDIVGNLYVADVLNNNIRKLTPTGNSWTVTTIGGQAGNPFGPWNSSDGAGSAARFYEPSGIAVDNSGNVYVADYGNNSIRKGTFTAYAPYNPVANSAPATNSSLTVTLLPPSANGQWRFGWEQAWRNSGTTASNLVAGNYPILFSSVPGYLLIQTNFTAVVPANKATYLTNQYYPTLNGGAGTVGTLTVDITPNVLAGTGWRFLGENVWRAPGSTATNLLPAVYYIQFEPVNGYATPANEGVQVYAGFPTLISAGYTLASAAPAKVLLPVAVPGNQIGNLTNYPFGFNGQLQSDVGYGSGVAVAANVVLTAAHIVFNDQTLNYVSQAYWYLQQGAGVSVLQPQVARGWYVLGGYATQRTNDILGGLAPDQSSPQSRNLDVAALYFSSPVAGGGYGGYLPSDGSPNPWLTGTSLKMLVGYPVDGSMFGDASIIPGVMYQTQPQPYNLIQAGDAVTNQQEVYTANWFLSYPGNSGGPLYVQFNGYYYPAGVYLGTLYNGVTPYASAVRAINSDVVNLITDAAALGDGGTNFSGGGVITIIPSQAVSANNPGYLEFQLGPPAAVAAGAGWELSGDSSFSSATNYIRAVLSTNAFTVVFKPIPGWNVPTNQSVSVTPGQIALYSALYTVSNSPPQLISTQVSGSTFQLSFQSVNGQSYTLYYNNNLATTNWLPYTNVTGNGGTLQLTVPVTNSAQRFFRISQP
jgi:hypothetical protein